MSHDDQPAIALPDGVTIQPRKMKEPKGRNTFFGWVDHANDENTYRFDDIIGAVRNREDGRYYIYIRQLSRAVAIPEKDYYRLLAMMGWSEESLIARAS